ncbi:hypothetical protein L9F63_017526, partial [Diploptera punctata]
HKQTVLNVPWTFSLRCICHHAHLRLRKQARKSEGFPTVTHKQEYPRNTMATQE